MNDYEDKFKSLMVDLFDEQYNDMVDKLEEYKSRLSVSETKELNQDDLNDLLFDVQDEAEYFMEESLPVYEETISGIGANELDELQVAIDFDLENPKVTEWLDDKKQQFATQVNETTWNSLQDTLNKGISAGEGIPELAERVKTVFDRAKTSRAEMIARTEVNGAANFGAHESYAQSGVVEEKEWIAALDERTRTPHRSAHTQTVKMDEMFNVGGEDLEYPGDPMGSAGNIINCRCALVPIVNES